MIDEEQINQNGIGLGLMISDKLVKQFGGKINVESVPDKGSVFTFMFKFSDISEVNTLCDNEENEEVHINSKKLDFRWKPNYGNLKKFKYTKVRSLFDCLNNKKKFETTIADFANSEQYS